MSAEGMAQQPAPKPAGGMSQIRSGVWNSVDNHAGKTVGQIRNQFGKMWGISEDSNAFIGKAKLNEDYVIQPGDNIEFHRRQGEKG